MKKSVLAFLVMVVLNILVTVVSVRMIGLSELNSIGRMFGLEMVIAFVVVVGLIMSYVLQKVDFGKLAWVIPVIISIPVAWHLVNLVLYMSVK